MEKGAELQMSFVIHRLSRRSIHRIFPLMHMRLLLAIIVPAVLLAACSTQMPSEDTGVVSSNAAMSVGMKIGGSSSGQSSVSDIVRKPITITGRIGCLPKKGPGPSTMECAMGLLGNANYALDAAKLPNGVFEYENEVVTVDGLLTPLEMISNDQMHTYDIVGVISVDMIERAE